MSTLEMNKETLNLQPTHEPLKEAETKNAMAELNQTDFIHKFPKVERRFADPPLDLQRIGLISFVPAKGATPNDKGIFGFAKLRGNFGTEQEANSQAEKLIRTSDSYNKIFHTYVGRPFPITTSSEFSKEVSEVDLKKEVSTAYSEDVKKKREQEQKDIEDIQEREKLLLEDVSKPQEITDDAYTTLRVKKAQLTWTYLETIKKIEQMAVNVAKARYEIEMLDEKQPELKASYLDRYMKARKQANLPTDREAVDTSFMKFLVEDVVVPELEDVYNKMYK